MAYEDDVILKKPFDFKISDFIVGSTKKKKVLSKQEQKWWLEFLKKDLYYSKYYDDYVILLGTGMRVSEFCGLTKKIWTLKTEQYAWIIKSCIKRMEAK